MSTAFLSFTHVVVFTRSRVYEQTTPAFSSIADNVVNISSLIFTDQDLDAGQLGGFVQWIEPADTPPQLKSYAIYFTQTIGGAGQSQIGSFVVAGTNQILVAQDTPKGSFGYVTLHARSSLAEQDMPAAITGITDVVARASGLTFVDMDLDAKQLSGNLSWVAPADISGVTRYMVYFAHDISGALRSQLGSAVTFESNEVTLPENTYVHTYTHAVVYTSSQLYEQTVPAGLALVDSDVTLAGLSLVDEDLDAGELGGFVTWTAPGGAAPIALYVANMATSTNGMDRSLLGQVSVGFNSIGFGSDLALGLYTHIVVFAASPLYEQTTPTGHLVSDAVASVSGTLFPDRDLDVGEVGGKAWWVPPADITRVAQYVLYLSSDSVGAYRALNGTVVQVGTNVLDLPADTNIIQGSFAYLLVYTKSMLFEQTTPAYSALVDMSSSTNVSFIDKDLDAYALGGDITWDAPTDISLVVHYVIYLAKDAAGTQRSQVQSDVSVITNTFLLPAHTYQGLHTHIVLYMHSSLAEQSTPAATLVLDAFANLTNLTFIDQDLDALQVGGPISWNEPEETDLITRYLVYLAADDIGAGRSLVANIAAVDDTMVTLSAETLLASFHFVLVFARSALAEQTTPAAMMISDSAGGVQNLNFADFDLDTVELGGIINWTLSADASVNALVTYYAVYLARDVAGGLRSKIGGDVPYGTTQISLPADTPLASYTYVVVYLQSALAQWEPVLCPNVVLCF